MLRAFVAGATGYTGREVVRQLASRGVATVAHVRPDSPAVENWRKRFASMNAVVDTTPWQPGAMTDSIGTHKPDVVFALLGTTQNRAKAAARAGGAPADYETVDYGMTHLLLEATRAAAPSATFVYVSATGASTDTRNEYLRVRGRIESELMTSGLTWIVARPLLISGSDREEPRPIERIGAVATDALLSFAGALGGRRLRDRFRSITSERLAHALINAAKDPRASNRILKPIELQERADRR